MTDIRARDGAFGPDRDGATTGEKAGTEPVGLVVGPGLGCSDGRESGLLPGVNRLALVLLVVAAAGGGVALTSQATTLTVRDVPKSTTGNQTLASLAPGTTYEASLLKPTPTFKATVPGWRGTQFVTLRHGKLAYETVGLLWHGTPGVDVGIYSGPALTTSPVETLTKALTRAANWTFDPYDPPGSVQHWTVAGRQALYFDATSPPPGSWTVLGANPPELKIDRDHAFRMSAVRVRGRTVVIIIAAPVSEYQGLLPAATRLIASLKFAA